MLFALGVGILLGVSNMGTLSAIMLLAVMLMGKVVIDIKYERIPVLDRVSPFVIYCHKLDEAGETVEQAWISYGMQLLLFGAVLGVAAFTVVRYIRQLL
jgi:K+-transporting ATPase A subunit